MRFSKKNKKQEVTTTQEENSIYNDGWMREDYILVSNKTKAKDLKPYQKLVVLRKPDGEQKCIIDSTLPYKEVQRIQELIYQQGYVDINSKQFTRIIPNHFKSESDKFELPKDEIEGGASTIKDVDTAEFNEFEIDPNLIPKSILKLEDNDYHIKLTQNQPLKNTRVDDVDLIDDIVINIPHEDRKIKWDTISEEDFETVENINQEELIVSDQPVSEDDYANQVILDENDVAYDYEKQLSENADSNNQDNIEYQEEDFIAEEISDENEYYQASDFNFVDDTEVEQQEQPELTVDPNFSNDYQEQPANEAFTAEVPQQTVTSFFKNEVAYNPYGTNQRTPSGNYYRFYEQTNTNPYESKVVNKKVKMVIRRRKIDKNLIEQNASKRQPRAI